MPSDLACTTSALYPAEALPLTLCSLTDWALVTLQGADRHRYLQGQVTCDVTTLQHNNYLPGAHCDVKGKMWSCFQLFSFKAQLALLQRRTVCERQCAALQHYAPFSQVTIQQNDAFALFGVAGSTARHALQVIFPQLPTAESPCLALENDLLLYFAAPSERFLIITAERGTSLSQSLQQQGALMGTNEQWLALEIAAEWPIIDAANSGQLLPQAVQLDQRQGVSFTKGCYMGQEGIARAHYRGTHKRALYWLSGQTPRQPNLGDPIEIQFEEQWRTSGRVLASVRLANGTWWLQVVLPHPLLHNTCLRVYQEPTSRLHIVSSAVR